MEEKMKENVLNDEELNDVNGGWVECPNEYRLGVECIHWATQYGDTNLYVLSQRFGCPVSVVCHYSGIAYPNNVAPGTHVYWPVDPRNWI